MDNNYAEKARSLLGKRQEASGTQAPEGQAQPQAPTQEAAPAYAGNPHQDLAILTHVKDYLTGRLAKLQEAQALGAPTQIATPPQVQELQARQAQAAAAQPPMPMMQHPQGPMGPRYG